MKNKKIQSLRSAPSFYNGKKGMELPIQIVVTMIIGLVIFGLGFGLFGKIASESDDTVDNLEKQVESGLRNLECEGTNKWVCVPSVKVRQGERTTVMANIINRGDTSGTFRISLKQGGSPVTDRLTSSDCGDLLITPYDDTITIGVGEGARVPIYLSAVQVTKQICSFTASVELSTGSPNPSDPERTPLIVRIE